MGITSSAGLKKHLRFEHRVVFDQSMRVLWLCPRICYDPCFFTSHQYLIPLNTAGDVSLSRSTHKTASISRVPHALLPDRTKHYHRQIRCKTSFRVS